MRVFDFNSAIVRTPGRSVVDGLTSSPGRPPDYETLLAEHRTYVAALESAGVSVTTLDPLERFPDSMFVEDPALVFAEAAILLRPGAPTRREEAAELRPFLTARFSRVLTLEQGFADGGDILVTPDEILIGLSKRTDEAGAKHLGHLLASIGQRSRVVHVPAGTLHLKSDCSLLDENTMLATKSLAGTGLFRDFDVILVPDDERAAANALRINDTLFLRAGFPRTRELVNGVDAAVVSLPGDEIAKIDAGLSCMSLRWLDPSRSRGIRESLAAVGVAD